MATATVTPRQREGEYPAQDKTRQPPENPQLRILHHTPGRYLCVNKPADVRIDGDFKHTVEKLALAYLNDGNDDTAVEGFSIRFIQRLDYATSGVILLGLSRAAAGVAATQFEKRQVHKEYVALVHGHITEEEVIIDVPIADGLPQGSYHMQVGTEDHPGRPSRTRCVPLQYGTFNNAPVTKVQLIPHSGRRHQLRVHMAHIGMPIVGDATYAEKEDHDAFHPKIPHRMMLHAKSLHVRLAVGGHLYGRKSGLRTAKPFVFDGGDPFCNSNMECLNLVNIPKTS